jgi:Phage P22-like portal protein
MNEKLQEVYDQAIENFNSAIAICQQERELCLSDRRFYSIAGAQWEGNFSRQFENKPKLEVNKINIAIVKIIGDYRNNRISPVFTSKKTVDLGDGETLQSLYLADEHRSGADEAFLNGFEEAVGGGFGAWRLSSAYEDEHDEESEDQKIEFTPIPDADKRVFFDIASERQDKADADWAFVLCPYSPRRYEDEFGDNPESWPSPISGGSSGMDNFQWATPDTIFVAEYYKKEIKKSKIHFFVGMLGEELKVGSDELKEDGKAEKLSMLGFHETRQKTIKRTKVRKYLLSGGGVLEDCGHIAGTNIPIVPVYGKRWFVDGVERYMGHVRMARDAQILKNMQLSKLAELSALSSREKPIFTPEQVVGWKEMWADDNIKDYPYLLLNSVTDANGQIVQNGPVAFTKSPMIPPAMAALLQISDIDIQSVLGTQDASEPIKSNISGLSVELQQNLLDAQNYIYISNMGKAIKRTGEIWLGMARDIYFEDGKEMKSMAQDGAYSIVKINEKKMNSLTNLTEVKNNFSELDFDVDVDIGPTSNSKKSAIVKNLTGIIQTTQDPETIQVLTGMVIANLQGEGLQDVKKYFRKKMVQMGAVTPNEEEAKMLEAQAQQAKPDPNSAYLQAAAEEAQAKAAKARADTLLVVAKADQTKADTARALASMTQEEQRHVLEVSKMLNETPSVNQFQEPLA